MGPVEVLRRPRVGRGRALVLASMSSLRRLGKTVLPEGALDWYRRRRAVRRYLKTLGRELFDRQGKLELEELEDRVLARRPDLTDRLTKDILERTDILLQRLDRQLEGVRARHGGELRSLRAEVDELRARVAALADVE